jgi:2-polyprenyl-6-methoxyphenol hydroxylase-like FAD-dependent oxidoreductase
MKTSYLKRKVAIIGCGPVGMLGTLLLEHFGLDFITIEKFPSTRSHPSAHWLSANSKAILSQIPNLNLDIDAHQ